MFNFSATLVNSQLVCLLPVGILKLVIYLFIYFFYLIQYLSRGIQFSGASLNGALTQHKTKTLKQLKPRQIIKLLLKMALKFDFKFAERLYLSNVSRNGVVSLSAVYSEATLILSSFCKGRAQQITASDVVAMEKVWVPKL